MAIPTAVAEQGKKASEAHRAAYPDLYKKEPAADPAQAPAQPAAPQPPGNTAPAAPAPNGLPTPPSPPQPPRGGEDIASLQHKLSVLQGKYNAEVPILQREVNTLRAENAALRTENASLKTQAPLPAKEPGKTGSDADPFKRIREDYGDDFANHIDSAINTRVESLVAQKTAPMAEKVSAVQATQVKTAEQTYYANLLTAVPRWMEINGHHDFQYWLGTPESLTGLPYQSLLERAHENLDAERVVNIFKAWPGFATFGAPMPPAVNPNKEQLDSLINPNPSAPNNQPPTDPNKPTYTQAQIQAFYEEVRRGLWKSRPKEQAAKEMDFGLAYKEGRIVG